MSDYNETGFATWDDLDWIQEQIFTIKARQREYDQHDDWCDYRADELHAKAWEGRNVVRVVKKRPCNCWLVKD